MVIGSIVRASIGFGSLVKDILDAKDRARYYKGLRDPASVLSKKDAEAQKKYNINPYYLLNQPEGVDVKPPKITSLRPGAYKYSNTKGYEIWDGEKWVDDNA